MEELVVIWLRPGALVQDEFNRVRLTYAHIERLFDLFRSVRFEIAALKQFGEKKRLLALLEPMNALFDEIYTFSVGEDDSRIV